MLKDKLSHEQIRLDLGSSRIQPGNGQVLLRYIPVEEKKSLVIVPNAERIIPEQGIIEEKDASIPTESLSLEKGTRVIFQPGTQYDLFMGEDKTVPSHCLVAWYDILAKVE